jgi:hypothetical protein
MLYLLGGFAVFGGFLLLVYLFINADPARLARGLRVTGIVIAVAAVATLAISGRLAALLMPLAMLMPLLIRVRSLLDRYGPPAGGQTSTVATAFLRMTLDHDTGAWKGRSCAAALPGCALTNWGRPISWPYCASAGQRMKRARGSWRPISIAFARIGATSSPANAPGAGGGGGRPASGDMSVEEAYAILGLSPGADAEAIKEAHRRLMVKLHPDHGGSDYLATKINRARDVLLHRR